MPSRSATAQEVLCFLQSINLERRANSLHSRSCRVQFRSRYVPEQAGADLPSKPSRHQHPRRNSPGSPGLLMTANAGAITGALAVSKLTVVSVSCGTATALAFYVAYWGLVGRLQKRGQVPDILDMSGLRQLFRLVALAELFVVYLAPLLAVMFAVGVRPAASPEGRSVLLLAAVYFLPNMIMTAVNIKLEGVFRRRRHLLVNYSSVAVNNLWRLTVYVLILLDEQRRRLQSTAIVPASTVTVLASFRSVAWAGFAISVLIMIIFEPVAVLALAPCSWIESKPAEPRGYQKT